MLHELLAYILGAGVYACIDYLDERRQGQHTKQPVYEPPAVPTALSDAAPRFAAMAMWLQGYGVSDISDELQCTEDAVLAALCADDYVLNQRPWDDW